MSWQLATPEIDAIMLGPSHHAFRLASSWGRSGQFGYGVGLRIKRCSVRIRPWPLRWVLGQGSLLPLSQGEAFTLASTSYLAILVKYILAKAEVQTQLKKDGISFQNDGNGTPFVTLSPDFQSKNAQEGLKAREFTIVGQIRATNRCFQTSLQSSSPGHWWTFSACSDSCVLSRRRMVYELSTRA